jgi:biopolymer transport protein ExbD
MKIRRKSRFHAEVSTHSLNDIMFFLLLFFLIISTVANPNVIRLMLPKAASSQQALNKQQVSLTIDQEKHCYVDKTPVELSQLESFLKQKLGGIESPTVVVRAHPSLSVQDLVDVLEIGVRIKVKMVLATEKKS